MSHVNPTTKTTVTTPLHSNKSNEKLGFRIPSFIKSCIHLQMSGHPRDQKKCLLKRGVRLYRRLKRQCLCVAENRNKCPPTRGVPLWEVSISRDLTVLIHLIRFLFSSVVFRVQRKKTVWMKNGILECSE